MNLKRELKTRSKLARELETAKLEQNYFSKDNEDRICSLSNKFSIINEKIMSYTKQSSFKVKGINLIFDVKRNCFSDIYRARSHKKPADIEKINRRLNDLNGIDLILMNRLHESINEVEGLYENYIYHIYNLWHKACNDVATCYDSELDIDINVNYAKCANVDDIAENIEYVSYMIALHLAECDRFLDRVYIVEWDKIINTYIPEIQKFIDNISSFYSVMCRYNNEVKTLKSLRSKLEYNLKISRYKNMYLSPGYIKNLTRFSIISESSFYNSEIDKILDRDGIVFGAKL